MDQLQEVQAQLEQWKTEGLDFSALQAAAQSTYAGGTTSLGLNRWSLNDKPTMEDFNRDNEIIDREIQGIREDLACKPNREPMEWHDLQFAGNWGPYYGTWMCKYAKDPFGTVYVVATICKTNEKPQRSELIATLPAGYRPPTNIIQWMFANAGINGVDPIVIVIGSDGTISIDRNASTSALENYTIGFSLPVHLCFPAAQ